MEGRIGNRVSFEDANALPPQGKTPLMADIVARQQSLCSRARALASGLQDEIGRLVGPVPQPSETLGSREIACYADALDANADEMTNALNAIEHALMRLQSGLG